MTLEAQDVHGTALELRLIRLAEDRATLFRVASTNGLTPDEEQRLRTTERELDECFLALRTQRAVIESRRFDRELWQSVEPPAPPDASGTDRH